MAYADTTRLKLYLGVDAASDDVLIGYFLSAAQAAIDSYCRQTFEASADTTRYFDPTERVRGRTLYLDAPLCAITTLTNGDGNTIDSSKYVKEPRNGTPWYALTLKANAGVAWTYTSAPENAISIAGKWAYSTSAPDDVVQACTRLAAYLYRQKDNQTGDLDRPVVASGGVVLMPSTLPSDIKSLLAPYRRLI